MCIWVIASSLACDNFLVSSSTCTCMSYRWAKHAPCVHISINHITSNESCAWRLRWLFSDRWCYCRQEKLLCNKSFQDGVNMINSTFNRMWDDMTEGKVQPNPPTQAMSNVVVDQPQLSPARSTQSTAHEKIWKEIEAGQRGGLHFRLTSIVAFIILYVRHDNTSPHVFCLRVRRRHAHTQALKGGQADRRSYIPVQSLFLCKPRPRDECTLAPESCDQCVAAAKLLSQVAVWTFSVICLWHNLDGEKMDVKTKTSSEKQEKRESSEMLKEEREPDKRRRQQQALAAAMEDDTLMEMIVKAKGK